MNKLLDRTILVVDDDEDLRDILTTLFSLEGCNTLSAESGQEALSVLEKHHVDLIVSDIRMPNGDGLFLLDKVKANERTPPPIVFITGYVTVTEDELLKRGASKIVSKPFDRDKILDAAKSCL